MREFNFERGTDLRTIALHTAAERSALFVREADEAVCLDDLRPSGPHPVSPYLDYDLLAAAIEQAAADAVWPGWGFVSEHADFAERCRDMGVTFIGPPPEVTRRLGDKIAAKLLAEEAGVPVAPWSGGAVASVEDARRYGEAIGYPLVVKAAAGGGGRGIRLVTSEADLAAAFESARAEAGRSFGDPTVFMEVQVTAARHVEVQVVADDHGTVWALGVRDCSIQRRNQKVIEESRSTALSEAQEEDLRAASVRLCARAGYRNAGTVEFLFQPAKQLFAFLEVNTRLQVEHPVTEMTTGLDLVKLQLQVARGERLEGQPPPPFGHAIEARLNAEDPQREFAPSPGTIALFALPNGPGLRVDTGVAEGDEISSEYDSMIAKVIAWGRDRDEARARLQRGLDDLTVVVRGGATNKSFLLDLLRRPEVVAGEVDTGWLDRFPPGQAKAWTRHADAALAVAAADGYDEEAAVQRLRFLASASRGRPQVSGEIGHTVELQHGGERYRVHVAKAGPEGWYRLEVDGAIADVVVERVGPYRSRCVIGGRSHRAVSFVHGTDHTVEIDGSLHRLSRDDGGVVRAPAAAVVVNVVVAPGAVVEAGARLLVVESMKMEVAISAPISGRIAEVFVSSNVQVDAGAPLLRIEPVAADSAAVSDSGGRVRFEVPAATGGDQADRCRQWLDALRWLMAGFDVTEGDARRFFDSFERDRRGLADRAEALVPAELQVLDTFADIASLTRNRRDGDVDSGEAAHNPRERFRSYLRSLDADREGLPERFRAGLLRALRHFGVHDLGRTPMLEEALYRIGQAHARAGSHLPVVVRLLEDLATQLPAMTDDHLHALRETLDVLILATQLRYPAIGNLARSLRYRAFDQPMIEASRRAVQEDARRQLQALAEGAGRDDSADAARIDRLVASPQPLLQLLADRIGNPDAREPVLEILTRRFYKIRPLEHLRQAVVAGQVLVTGEYAHRDR
ncbi:MAG: hypothetical protein QOG64_1196, partial [Acidimicrobiaceae bacterium]|nr:hypothetical protein [Acidimicrobiaceae bacterium]